MSTDGLVLIDKPTGWTSHDVVARTRRLARTRKVGHAGTLDPMATGLLVLGVNRATRLLTYLVGADKEYTATIRLGQDTSTDDAEGEVTSAAGAAQVDLIAEELPAAMAALTGSIEQVPSTVSAIKVDGERAYARARAGEQVVLTARPVHVEVFERTGPVTSARADDGTSVVDVDVRVVCSSGTYIRALARDLGRGLGTGGHLTRLRRSRVGPFTIDQAQPLPEPDDEAAPVQVRDLTAVCSAVFDVLHLPEPAARALRYGQFIDAPGPDGERAAGAATATGAAPAAATGAPRAAMHPDGHVVALVEDRGRRLKPVLVLDPA